MFSTTKHVPTRTLARVAVAGAIAAAPLTALAVPAQADTAADSAGPVAAEVRHGHGPWDRPHHRHRHGHHDLRPFDHGFDHPGGGWRQAVPPGWLGSS